MASIMDLLMESLGLERRAPVIRAFTIDIASGKFDPENDDHCFYEQMVYEGTGIELDTNWRVDTYSVFAAENLAQGEYSSNCQLIVDPLEESIISIEVEDGIDFDEAVGLLVHLCGEIMADEEIDLGDPDLGEDWDDGWDEDEDYPANEDDVESDLLEDDQSR